MLFFVLFFYNLLFPRTWRKRANSPLLLPMEWRVYVSNVPLIARFPGYDELVCVLTSVVTWKQEDVLLDVMIWGGGVLTSVVRCKQKHYFRFPKYSCDTFSDVIRSLLLANKDHVLRWMMYLFGCRGGGVGLMTLVVTCKERWCSSVDDVFGDVLRWMMYLFGWVDGGLMTFVGILPDKSVECSWQMPKRSFWFAQKDHLWLRWSKRCAMGWKSSKYYKKYYVDSLF